MRQLADRHHPDLAKIIAQAVQNCLQKHPSTNVYALLDAPWDMNWAEELWASSQTAPSKVQCIYTDTALAGLEKYSLFLIPVVRSDLEALLQRANCGPMLSLIQTTLSLEQLRQHLARFARLQTSDGQWLLQRWGYSLMVSAMIQTLSPTQRELLHSGFAAWHLINRQGTLDTIQGSMDAALALGTHDTEGMLEHGYAMSDRAFAALLDANEADALLSAIYESAPQILQGRTPSVVHNMASWVLQRMKELGIPQGQKQIQLLAQAIMQPTADAALALLRAHQANTPAGA